MNSFPEIRRNLFIGNTASSGAAIGSLYSSPEISENVIIGNASALRGGGIYSRDDVGAFIEGNLIVGNTCLERGGGVGFFDSSPVFVRNTVAGNSSRDGGGIYFATSASPIISSCTITANSADSSGAGIYCEVDCSPTIENTIVWGDEGDEVVFEPGASPVLTYCSVEGGWPGQGNIDADPLFVLAEKQDYRLLWLSPCIDSGHPDSLDPDGTRSDIGAEFFDQDDYLTLYLTPDTTEVAPGAELGVTYTAINRWAQPEPFWVLTEAVLPTGDTLGVMGPEAHTLPAAHAARVHVVHGMPPFAPTGWYEYSSKIGHPPATLYDEDRFRFQVTEPGDRPQGR